VETKFTPEAVAKATPPSRRIGLKAFYLEPWLILGSFVLWLTVLPFAGLRWSGAALLKRIETLSIDVARQSGWLRTHAGGTDSANFRVAIDHDGRRRIGIT
jgi:hypothetical protein